MNESDCIWIRKEDVDLALTHEEIFSTLPKNHRILGYLELFLSLPPELLAIIFCAKQDILLQVPKISLGISKLCEKSFYAYVCDFPVNEWEIRREAKIGIYLISPDTHCGHSIGFYEHIDEEFQVTEVEGCFELNPGVIDFHEENNWEADNNINGFFDYREPTIFSEYRILTQRGNCMRYNSQYANERLIARWKRDKLVSIEDMKGINEALYFLTANYLAFNITEERAELLSASKQIERLDNRVEMFHETVDINDSSSKKGANIHLQKWNKLIDEEIIRLISL